MGLILHGTQAEISTGTLCGVIIGVTLALVGFLEPFGGTLPRALLGGLRGVLRGVTGRVLTGRGVPCLIGVLRGFSGRVLTGNGVPLRGVFFEIGDFGVTGRVLLSVSGMFTVSIGGFLNGVSIDSLKKF